VTRLTNPHTGHELDAVDDVDVEFWTAAGYRPAAGSSTKKAPAKKAAKKSSAKKAGK
jgi:hypothetical protein